MQKLRLGNSVRAMCLHSVNEDTSSEEEKGSRGVYSLTVYLEWLFLFSHRIIFIVFSYKNNTYLLNFS